MLYFAAAIADPNALLQPIDPPTLLERLRNDQTLRDDILRLRKVRLMDGDAYRRLKARLPYFCCADFREGVRRTAHFIAAGAFVIDVDHYSAQPSDLGALRARLLVADDRIVMAFISPGGDGLKLLFRLDRPCTDTKQFSDFYKSFAASFGEKHGLTPYIDFRTADATRACFLSHDPEAYCDPIAEPVCWQAWLPESVQPALTRLLAGEQTHAGTAPVSPGTPEAATSLPIASIPEQMPPPPNKSHAIRPDVYAEILRKLKTQARPNPVQRPLFVPAALDLVLPVIREALSAQSIEVVSTTDIQYGKQLTLAHGVHQAALNLFYGKKGFSIVVVPKRNTHPELSELAQYVAEQAVYSHQEWAQSGEAQTDEIPY